MGHTAPRPAIRSGIDDSRLAGVAQDLEAALVGRDGSIDRLCLPNFGSGACFAALLGSSDHGRWLLRAVAGDPSQLQIMYGASGERRPTELELPWLPG